MSPLLRKLRLKFVFTTTGIVALLVVAVVAAYCLSIYTSAKGAIDGALDHAINTSIAQADSQGRQTRPGGQMPGGSQLGVDGQMPTDDQAQPSLPSTDSDIASSDQRIDLFRGASALVYSAVLNNSGAIVRYDSPAIVIEDDVLTSAIQSIMSSPEFSMTDGATFSGRLSSENLYYKIRIDDGYAYLALADASLTDSRLQDALFGSLIVAGVALLLTVIVSFFLARLFIRPVEEAWSKQRRFVADASHELKTPLTVIMANTEIVRLDPTATVGSQMKWLDGIMDESERMHGLIADLLLLARIDDEQTLKEHLQAEDVDFSEAVEKSFMSFEAIAFERNLSLEGKVGQDIIVSGIPSRLSRLPDILIDNACKYAPQGTTVTVELEKQGANAVLRAFNAGEPIAPGDLDRLFDRFYRADVSRSSDIPGYGLGLSIARSVVEEVRGTITVENVAGKGVAFTVTLPRTKR